MRKAVYAHETEAQIRLSDHPRFWYLSRQDITHTIVTTNVPSGSTRRTAVESVVKSVI